jgi:hypothetical protein
MVRLKEMGGFFGLSSTAAKMGFPAAICLLQYSLASHL